MERNIVYLLLFKIAGFLFFLSWICYFSNEVCTFNRSLSNNYNIVNKLGTRNYRLLAKYKQDRDFYCVELKEHINNNWNQQKKYISNNEKGIKRKNKKYNRNSLNKAQYYTEVIDYNNGMFDEKHFHFEKKWIKKKDDNFLEKRRRICDIALKKIKYKNYGYIVAMYLIFSLLVVGIDVLPRLKSLDTAWKKLDSGNILRTLYDYVKSWDKTVKTSVYLTLFSVIIIILIIVLVIGICNVLSNNEKHNKIKLMIEKNE
ncbi:fam-m protein [Plasmodium malariae]|uniref:Fam-m protein n=1 Tax=Plasmodium malariae TaxID=5858 RepID=A0A1D3JHN1_PLAMA|nr:fam-m protein [Plasmodium malariae]SBT85925.1 fam-m protein [Plasmodium malariae]